MTEQTFAAGHVFFRPGDPGERAFLVHDGQVELLTGSEGAFERVGLLEAGDVFGEMSLIEERPRSLTARAVTAVRVSPMSREDFEHHLTHDPARSRHYLRALFERLRSMPARPGGETTPPAVINASRAGPVEMPFASGRPTGWAVVVYPLTRKAAETLPDEGLRVTRFPLRFGRVAAANEPEPFDLNDVWLLDEKPFNVSRNHCEIHCDAEGPMVRDRGSHLGCVVNDVRIGGRAPMGYARLLMGDNVVLIGAQVGRYQYRVHVSRA